MDIYYVVVECPHTGKAVRTGVELEDVEAFAFVGRKPRACACAHCEGWHVWSRHDAWLERHDVERPRRSASAAAPGESWAATILRDAKQLFGLNSSDPKRPMVLRRPGTPPRRDPGPKR